MRMTLKGTYAIRAILDIASSTGTVGVREISIRQKIEYYFLTQICRKLKQAGLIKTKRGPGGGYVLAKEPYEITVLEILNAVGEVVDISESSKIDVLSVEYNILKGYLGEMMKEVRNYLETDIETLLKEGDKNA